MFKHVKAAALAVCVCLLCACGAPYGELISGDSALCPAKELLSGSVRLEPGESGVPAMPAGGAGQSGEAGKPPLPGDALTEEAARIRREMERDREALDEALAAIFVKYGAVGVSVTAFVGEEPVYSFHWGLADVELGLPVTASTKYRAASVSKLVTAMLCLMEADSGALPLNTDVQELIGAGLRNPYCPDTPVTVEQLLTHTSGFFDGGPYLSAIEIEEGCFPPLERLTEDAGALSCSEPGKKWVYTNFGMGLAAGAVEAVCGERFSDRAQELLFGPMGIDAGFMPDCLENPGDIASIYMQGELRVNPREWLGMAGAYSKIPIGQMYLLGQGELYISSDGLARVLSVLAGDGTFRGRRYLSAAAMENMHTVRTEGKQGSFVIRQALGVREYRSLIEGRVLNGHEGQAYGMVSGAIYDRAARCGMALLTNGCSSQREPCGILSVNAEAARLLWGCIGTEERA